MPPIPDGCSPLLRDFLIQCFHKDPSMRPSAELLFEHPWLAENWGLHKDLRPQDSIPFLRRISADLQKSDIAKYFSTIDIDVPDSPTDDTSTSPPRSRISEISEQFLNDNDLAPRDHSFVKTTFSKAMICRVCLMNVKKSAVLCEHCNLFAHSKCAVRAPPTCDFRSQLLLYAKYAEMGNPSSSRVPLESTRTVHSATSDISFPPHKTNLDSPISSQPFSGSQISSTHKFLGALHFKRSRSNPSSESPPIRPFSLPIPSKDEDIDSRTISSRVRPQSLQSSGAELSRMRSPATTDVNFSSRMDAMSAISLDGTYRSQGSGNPLRVATKDDLVVTTRTDYEPADISNDPHVVTRRKGRRDAKSSGCVLQ